MTLSELAGNFTNPDKTGDNSFQVCCPSHEDSTASLTITEKDDKYIMYCHAGCDTKTILGDVGLSMTDLFKDNGATSQATKRNSNSDIVYPYIDEDGSVLYEKVRFTGSKGVFRHTDKDGNIIWSLSKGTFYETKSGSGIYSKKKEHTKNNMTIEVKENIERILYNLPDVVQAVKDNETIYICEGEKDVETLRDLGLTGTTNFDGAGKGKFKKHYAKYFTNADVIVIPDCDKAGEQHQKTIKDNLFNSVKSIKVIKLPNVKGKKGYDLTDYIETGHTKDDLLKLVKETKENLTVESDEIEVGIFNHKGCYARHTKNGVKPITNFVIALKEIISNEETQQVRADFINIKGYTVEKVFDIKALNTRRHFIELVSDIYFTFTGNDNDLQELKQVIGLQDYRELIGVNYIGFNKIRDANVFVTNTKTIDSNLETTDDIVITDDNTLIKTDILEVEGIQSEELKEISKYLFDFNKLEVTSSILGSIITMMIKERLKAFNIKTQHLMLFGEAGAGKSETLSQIISPFFSYESNIISSTGLTKFTAIKNISSSNTIPLLLEEYKPSEMNDRQKDMLLDMFRNIYDEHSEQRGNKNQTVTEYPLLSPIIAVGEEQVEQTAVIERSIITTFSKLESEKENRTASYLYLKNNKHLMQKFGRSILNIALQITDPELETLITESNILTNELFKGRVRQNVTNTIVGVKIIDKLYQDLGLDIEVETGHKVNDITNAINNNVYNENLEGTSDTKTIIDNTLEIIDLLVDKYILRENEHFSYMNNGTELALRPNAFYSDLTKFKKEYAIETSILTTAKNFTKMLRTTDYFIGYKNAVFVRDLGFDKVETKRMKSYVLDVQKLKDKGLDMENLLSDYNIED